MAKFRLDAIARRFAPPIGRDQWPFGALLSHGQNV
jgi:hypothetical protein